MHTKQEAMHWGFPELIPLPHTKMLNSNYNSIKMHLIYSFDFVSLYPSIYFSWKLLSPSQVISSSSFCLLFVFAFWDACAVYQTKQSNFDFVQIKMLMSVNGHKLPFQMQLLLLCCCSVGQLVYSEFCATCSGQLKISCCLQRLPWANFCSAL